ncbi:hypothetical protein FOA52_014860 [Chlamydomonas sp. UWO 241]|nr:hypothetical protein FOA52_014860 [Chlamydomonas sp. UWO 241]
MGLFGGMTRKPSITGEKAASPGVDAPSPHDVAPRAYLQKGSAATACTMHAKSMRACAAGSTKFFSSVIKAIKDKALSCFGHGSCAVRGEDSPPEPLGSKMVTFEAAASALAASANVPGVPASAASEAAASTPPASANVPVVPASATPGEPVCAIVLVVAAPAPAQDLQLQVAAPVHPHGRLDYPDIKRGKPQPIYHSTDAVMAAAAVAAARQGVEQAECTVVAAARELGSLRDAEPGSRERAQAAPLDPNVRMVRLALTEEEAIVAHRRSVEQEVMTMAAMRASKAAGRRNAPAFGAYVTALKELRATRSEAAERDAHALAVRKNAAAEPPVAEQAAVARRAWRMLKEARVELGHTMDVLVEAEGARAHADEASAPGGRKLFGNTADLPQIMAGARLGQPRESWPAEAAAGLPATQDTPRPPAAQDTPRPPAVPHTPRPPAVPHTPRPQQPQAALAAGLPVVQPNKKTWLQELEQQVAVDSCDSGKLFNRPSNGSSKLFNRWSNGSSELFNRPSNGSRELFNRWSNGSSTGSGTGSGNGSSELFNRWSNSSIGSTGSTGAISLHDCMCIVNVEEPASTAPASAPQPQALPYTRPGSTLHWAAERSEQLPGGRSSGRIVRAAIAQLERLLPASLSSTEATDLQSIMDRGMPYNEQSPAHRGELLRLWQLAFLGVPSPESLKDDLVKEMGWQSADPATDMRGSGLFGLQCLRYMAEAHPGTFARLMRKMDGVRAEYEYPFAASGLNLQVFVAVYELLDMEWLKAKASYMAFGPVILTVRNKLSAALAARPRNMAALRAKMGLGPVATCHCKRQAP